MAKRFTDTEIWDKAWFRKLEPRLKEAWRFLCEKCDNAGIWSVDMEVMSFLVGAEITLNDLLENFEVELHDDKIFVKGFIEFQYKVPVERLNPENNAHKSVLDKLKRLAPAQPLASPCPGVLDKDKDKDKDSIKEGVQKKRALPEKDLLPIYDAYPRKQGKAVGLAKLKTTIKTPEDLALMLKAVARFSEVMAREKRAPDKIPYFSTFVQSQWRDYLDDDVGSVHQATTPRTIAEEFVDAMISVFHSSGSAYEGAGPENYALWKKHIGLTKADFANSSNDPKYNRGKWVDTMERVFTKHQEQGASA